MNANSAYGSRPPEHYFERADEKPESLEKLQANYRVNLESDNPDLASEMHWMKEFPVEHRFPSWFRDTSGLEATTIYTAFPTPDEVSSIDERRVLADSIVQDISRNTNYTVDFAQNLDISHSSPSGVMSYTQAADVAARGLVNNDQNQFFEGLDQLRRLRRNVQRTLDADYPEYGHEEFQADDENVARHMEQYSEVLAAEYPSTQAAFLDYKQNPSENNTRELANPAHFHSIWKAFHKTAEDLSEPDAEALADLIAAELFAPKLDKAFSYITPSYDPAAHLNQAVYDRDSFNTMYKASASDSITATFQAADHTAELIRFNDPKHFAMLTGYLSTVDTNQHLLEQSVDHTSSWHTEDAKEQFETARTHRTALMYQSFTQDFQTTYPEVESHADAVDPYYHDDIAKFLDTHMRGDRQAFLVHLCQENARQHDKSADPDFLQANWHKVAHLARPTR